MTILKPRRPFQPHSLELLPVEILQDIFLRTHSVNFALCSPLIGSRLSNNFCYHWICYEFFFERATEAWQGWLQREEKIKALKEQQARLLAMRWMTPVFFKTFIRNVTSISASHKKIVDRCLSHCHIPPRLLRGPWTDQTIDFIQYLLDETPLRLDWSCERTRRAVTEGKKSAILECNKSAVVLFIKNRQLGKPPNMDLIRFAVISAGCDRTIVFMLLVAARQWGLRMWQDEVLDEWIREAKSQCNPKGDWLQLKLLELRQPGGFPDPETGNYSLPNDELNLTDIKPGVKARTNRFAYSPAALGVSPGSV